jgi:protein-S-isoprenylcysteine O-methyltransferase Ste14
MIFQTICTLVVVYTFLSMTFGYGSLRKGKRYGLNREKAPSLTFFNLVSKVLFIFGCLMSICSFWSESSLLVKIHSIKELTAIGLFFVIVGRWNLKRSFKSIGRNYSPLFDAYLPHEIVTTGSYQTIRHPIYLYNLFVSFGLAFASGSLLVFVSASFGLAVILKTIHIEEDYLSARFPETFNLYKKNTWKMIPKLF